MSRRRPAAEEALKPLEEKLHAAMLTLLAMKEYWGENDAVELDGRQVQLVNELYAELQKLTRQVRPDRVT